MASQSIYVVSAADVTVSGGGSLSGHSQGDGSQLAGKTITLNAPAWSQIGINDGNTEFGDNDGSQTLAANTTLGGVTYGAGLIAEAEYIVTVQDALGHTYQLVGFNINEPGSVDPSFGTVEGLAFLGPPGAWPPTGTPLTVVSTSEGPGDHGIASQSYATYVSPICFVTGTLIATAEGERAVETLVAGDIVLTRDNGPQPVVWTGATPVGGTARAGLPAFRPVRFAAGAVGPRVATTTAAAVAAAPAAAGRLAARPAVRARAGAGAGMGADRARRRRSGGSDRSLVVPSPALPAARDPVRRRPALRKSAARAGGDGQPVAGGAALADLRIGRAGPDGAVLSGAVALGRRHDALALRCRACNAATMPPALPRHGSLPPGHVPDLLAPGLRLVFCGTALGRVSAERRAYYANPTNAFWATLHAVGLTPRRFAPQEWPALLDLGIGLTDLSKGHFGNDADLPAEAFDVAALKAKVAIYAPRVLAFTSKTGAAAVLGRGTGRIALGFQPEMLGPTRLYVLPSPSGQARVYWDRSAWEALAEAVRESPGPGSGSGP